MMLKSTGRDILLVGGEGFIGRNIAGYFSWENTCVSVGSKLSFFEQRTDVFLLANPYEESIRHESDVIVHLIDNKVPIDTFVAQEEHLVRNIGLKKDCHLIVFSSAVVYANPDSEYGQRKRALERFYAEYCEANGIRLTIFRLFNTYGPYQIPYRQGSLVGNLLYNALTGIRTDINDPEAMRDFLYAGDIPRCIEHAIEHRMVGIHDMGSGQLTSIGELIALLNTKVVDGRLDIAYRDNRESIPNRCADSDWAKGIALTGLEEGLRRTVKFYEENMPLMKKIC